MRGRDVPAQRRRAQRHSKIRPHDLGTQLGCLCGRASESQIQTEDAETLYHQVERRKRKRMGYVRKGLYRYVYEVAMQGFLLLLSGSWEQHRVWLGVIFFFQQTSAGRSSNGKWGVVITYTHIQRGKNFHAPKRRWHASNCKFFGFGWDFVSPPTWARSGLIRAGKDMIPYMATVGILAWAGMGWGRIRSSGHTRAMYRSKHHKSSLMVWPEHIYIYIIYYFTQCVSICLHL